MSNKEIINIIKQLLFTYALVVVVVMVGFAFSTSHFRVSAIQTIGDCSILGTY